MLFPRPGLDVLWGRLCGVPPCAALRLVGSAVVGSVRMIAAEGQPTLCAQVPLRDPRLALVRRRANPLPPWRGAKAFSAGPAGPSSRCGWLRWGRS